MSTTDPTPEIVSIRLTSEQTAAVSSVIERQRASAKSALLSVLSHSFEPDAGQAVTKLDIVWLDRKTAARVVRLIREAKGAK